MCFGKYCRELKRKMVKMERMRVLVLLVVCVVCEESFGEEGRMRGVVM